MSDTWTPQQRFDDTVKYLQQVNAGLAAHVQQTLPISKDQAGKDISLKGNPRYAMFGNSAVGRAVRALRLCHLAYLGTNWARQTGGAAGAPCNRNSPNGATLTMDTYLSKSEPAVKEAIMAYVALTPAPSALADAAELLGNGAPINPPFEKMTRAQNPFPSGQICFDCVYWWLFKSGFVSLRWILHKGMALGAQNANTFLGDGTPINVSNDLAIKSIPRGTILNWRGDQPDTRDICHWAVALGSEYAAGANNTLAGKIKSTNPSDKDRDVEVRFLHGKQERTFAFDDSKFGVFRIKDMCEVYAGLKTQSSNTGRSGYVLAGVQPVTIPDRDTGS